MLRYSDEAAFERMKSCFSIERVARYIHQFHIPNSLFNYSVQSFRLTNMHKLLRSISNPTLAMESQMEEYKERY